MLSRAIVVFVLFFASSTNYANVQPYDEQSIFTITIGDSVTKGVWADASVGEPGLRFYFNAIQAKIQAGLIKTFFGIDHKLASLTNKIEHTKKLEKYFNFVSRESLSALAGSSSYSIPTKIVAATGRKNKNLNASFLAASYSTSSLSLNYIDEFYQKNPYHKDPQIVFVSYSGMDFMFQESLFDFNSNVQYLFKEIFRRFPNTYLVVTPIIDIVSILTAKDRLSVPENITSPALYCSDIYDQMGLAEGIDLSPEQTGLYVMKLRNKIKVMNNIIKLQLGKINFQLGLNGKSNYGIFVNDLAISSVDLSEFLSADCFHPSIMGQEFIGNKVWNKIIKENILQNI